MAHYSYYSYITRSMYSSGAYSRDSASTPYPYREQDGARYSYNTPYRAGGVLAPLLHDVVVAVVLPLACVSTAYRGVPYSRQSRTS